MHTKANVTHRPLLLFTLLHMDCEGLSYPCNCFNDMTFGFRGYLAIVVLAKVRMAALNLIPHALHVMQVVGLVAVLGEHGSSLLCLLYLASSELPLGGLAVQEPAHMQRNSAAWVGC